MTVEKMLWDVWRNVTSATTGWSLGGSSSKGHLPTSSSSTSSKSAQYNRLKSSGGGGGGGAGGRPTKSISQPANLTGLSIYSSSESLEGKPPEASSSSSRFANIEETSPAELNKVSAIAPHNWKTTANGRKIQHSISSFFPFNSFTSTTNDKTSQTSRDPSGQSHSSAMPTSSSSSSSGVESPSNGLGFFTNIFNSVGGSGSARGNKISLRPSYTTVEMDDIGQKEKSQDIICEDDISDLDDDVEHLTCDVCDRAFPTLRQLAAHQRKKRHYGCLQCDSIFPSREILEYHREQMDHYDYVVVDDVYEEGGEGDTDFFESEDDEHGLREDEDCDDEERERLL